MSLRARLVVATTVAVLLTVGILSAFEAVALGRAVRRTVDQALEQTAERARVVALSGDSPQLPGAAQVVDAGDPSLPEEVRAVAEGRRTRFLGELELDGRSFRVLAIPLDEGRAVQVAREGDELRAGWRRLTMLLGAATAGGVLLSLVAGSVVAAVGLRPLRRLTEAAEDVATTGDLGARVAVVGAGELARLAAAFNAMLESLQHSVRTQRQLVADASHELRTPLTSIRTNVEVLARTPRMKADERNRLVQETVHEAEGLSVLIADLVELARIEAVSGEHDVVDLARVVDEEAERAQARARHVTVTTDLREVQVVGDEGRIIRLVSNLLDNAVKWSPPDGVVEVTLVPERLTVRDHGPGIAEEDRPQVFDRFYRARSARALPGSGLGLAIVREVADGHGWTVTADPAPGGGTAMVVHLGRAG